MSAARSAVDSLITPARDGETVQWRDVRFRTVGDVTCTCPVDSRAATPAEVVLETLSVEVSEARLRDEIGLQQDATRAAVMLLLAVDEWRRSLGDE